MKNTYRLLLLSAMILFGFTLRGHSVNIQYSISGLKVYFMADTIPLADSICTHEWDFGDGSPHVFLQQPTHTYATHDTFTVILKTTINNGIPLIEYGTLEFILVCVPPVASYVGTSIPGSNTVSFVNNSFGLPIYGPLTYAWDFGDGNTSTAQDTPYPYAVSGDTFNTRLIVTNSCGSDTAYLVATPGYQDDYPKNVNPCIPGGKYTPTSWRNSNHQFPLDSDNNGIDDAIDASSSSKADIIVYYSIPPGGSFSEAITVLDPLISLGSHEFAQYLTVVRIIDFPVKIWGVTNPVLTSMLTSPWVHFIQSDAPISCLTITSPSSGPVSSLREVMEILEIRSANNPGTCPGNQISQSFSNPNLTGEGVPVGILGSGISDHVSNSTVNVTDLATFSGSTNILGAAQDLNGHGVASSSLVGGCANSGSQQVKGVVSRPNISYIKVVDQNSKVRPMDIILGVEHIIDSAKVQLLLCDFDLGFPSDGSDCCSAIMDVASMYKILVIASAGNLGSAGITSPGASRYALTTGYSLEDPCNISSPYSVGVNSGQGTSLGLHYQKPDLVTFGGETEAADCSATINYTDTVNGPLTAAALTTGIAAMMCQQNNTMTPQSLRHLLIHSALDILPNTFPQIWDPIEGNGNLNAYEVFEEYASITPSDKINLKFTEHSNLAPPTSFNSLNIDIYESSVLTAGTDKTVTVSITNDGAIPYDSLSHHAMVNLGVFSFSNAVIIGDKVASRYLPDIPAGVTVTCDLVFTPETGMDGACFKASIVYPFDSHFSDNSAHKNTYYVTHQGLLDTISIALMLAIPVGKTVNLDSVASDLAGTGISMWTSFTPGLVSADTFNNTWVTYKFWADPNSQFSGPASYDVAFVAGTGPEQLNLGGVNFTFDLPTSSTEPHEELLDFNIVPNPNSGISSIFVKLERPETVEISLLDIRGAVLKQWQPKKLPAGNSSPIALDLSAYAKGIYFVRLKAGDHFSVKKVIKL